jgi:hypothetical protein
MLGIVLHIEYSTDQVQKELIVSLKEFTVYASFKELH